MVLDRLPLTANAKLDRDALPDLGATAYEFVAAWSELERQLAVIWQEVVSLPTSTYPPTFGASMTIPFISSTMPGAAGSG